MFVVLVTIVVLVSVVLGHGDFVFAGGSQFSNDAWNVMCSERIWM